MPITSWNERVAAPDGASFDARTFGAPDGEEEGEHGAGDPRAAGILLLHAFENSFAAAFFDEQAAAASWPLTVDFLARTLGP